MVRARAIAISLAAASALAGCTLVEGIGGLAVGYGAGYDPYDEADYYGDRYYGWHEEYYYPGTGYYVYDRGGRRHAWTTAQRRHWEARRAAIRAGREGDRDLRENWSEYRRERHGEWRDGRGDGRSHSRGDRRERRESGEDGWRDGRGNGNGEDRAVRREPRADAPPAAPPPAAAASRRGPADPERTPRPQVEARPQPEVSRPDPQLERADARADGEELAPHHRM